MTVFIICNFFCLKSSEFKNEILALIPHFIAIGKFDNKLSVAIRLLGHLMNNKHEIVHSFNLSESRVIQLTIKSIKMICDNLIDMEHLTMVLNHLLSEKYAFDNKPENFDDESKILDWAKSKNILLCKDVDYIREMIYEAIKMDKRMAYFFKTEKNANFAKKFMRLFSIHKPNSQKISKFTLLEVLREIHWENNNKKGKCK